MFVLGVDGCRAGWIAVALSHGSFAGAAVFTGFRQLIAQVRGAAAVCVDVPIGLLPGSMRVCDALAREALGPGSDSMFLIPPRSVMALDNYDEADTLCRRLTGQGLSREAFSLRQRILEVDVVLREEALLAASADRAPLVAKPRDHPARKQAERVESRESLRRLARIIEPDGGAAQRDARQRLLAGRVVEVHPELSFRELAGVPLEHAKNTTEGIRQRWALLHAADIRIPAELESIGGVASDDLLDAAAAAWSANRYAQQRARCIPPQELWQQDGDRIVAIWM